MGTKTTNKEEGPDIMRITEKLLLDHYVGMTNGMDYISQIAGEQINWVYRKGDTGAGYNCAVEDREDAVEITLERYRHGTIPLDPACEAHPALGQMRHDVAKMVGTEI